MWGFTDALTASIEYEIEADDKEDAAIRGLRRWVINSEGTMREKLNERYVKVNNELIDDVSEDDLYTDEAEH